MAKLSREEKKRIAIEKRAAAKAKREAKKAARIEKLKKITEKKRAKREAKKAARLARLEKEKAKKLALREKKRLAREKKRALETAKKIKVPAKKLDNPEVIDIRAAARTIRNAMKQIAADLAALDETKREKKIKAITNIGYDVAVENGLVTVGFGLNQTKQIKTVDAKPVVEKKPKVKAPPKETEVVEPDSIDDLDSLKPPADLDLNLDDEDIDDKMIPAGDIYGADGKVGNIDGTDDLDGDDNEDDTIDDSRDETDEGLIDARREFFNQYGEDFEVNE